MECFPKGGFQWSYNKVWDKPWFIGLYLEQVVLYFVKCDEKATMFALTTGLIACYNYNRVRNYKYVKGLLQSYVIKNR